jgi:hypothetical protein
MLNVDSSVCSSATAITTSGVRVGSQFIAGDRDDGKNCMLLRCRSITVLVLHHSSAVDSSVDHQPLIHERIPSLPLKSIPIPSLP